MFMQELGKTFIVLSAEVILWIWMGTVLFLKLSKQTKLRRVKSWTKNHQCTSFLYSHFLSDLSKIKHTEAKLCCKANVNATNPKESPQI